MAAYQHQRPGAVSMSFFDVTCRTFALTASSPRVKCAWRIVSVVRLLTRKVTSCIVGDKGLSRLVTTPSAFRVKFDCLIRQYKLQSFRNVTRSKLKKEGVCIVARRLGAYGGDVPVIIYTNKDIAPSAIGECVIEGSPVSSKTFSIALGRGPVQGGISCCLEACRLWNHEARASVLGL